MYVASRLNPSENGESVLVTDKRGRRVKPSQREDDWLPISELGSKAIFQVHAEQFIAAAS